MSSLLSFVPSSEILPVFSFERWTSYNVRTTSPKLWGFRLNGASPVGERLAGGSI